MKFIKSNLFAVLATLLVLVALAVWAAPAKAAQPTFNLGVGISRIDGTTLPQNKQVTISAGVEVSDIQILKQKFWVGVDTAFTAAPDNAQDLLLSTELKLGAAFGDFRPYLSTGYVVSNMQNPYAVGLKNDSKLIGVGVRYDVTKAVFLDTSYKKANKNVGVATVTLHYNFK